MGVGGAVLYSLGAEGARAIWRLARESINSLRRVWRAERSNGHKLATLNREVAMSHNQPRQMLSGVLLCVSGTRAEAAEPLAATRGFARCRDSGRAARWQNDHLPPDRRPRAADPGRSGAGVGAGTAADSRAIGNPAWPSTRGPAAPTPRSVASSQSPAGGRAGL
jgi:hypothetical protein